MNAPDGSRHRSDAAPVPDPGAMLEHAPLPERVALAARFALLVMSPYGTRPWRLSATGDTMELAALPGRRLAIADPDGRALFAACGAVLFTLRCALLRFGLSTEPLWLPGAGQPLSGSEPVPLVRLRVTESAACPPTERVMFDAIGLNHAWQGRFDPAAPSARLVDAIQAHARSEGAWLGVVDEPRGRAALCAIVVGAERRWLADRRFRSEFMYWQSIQRQQPGGDPLLQSRLGGLGEFVRPFLMLHDPGPPGDLLGGAPLLAVLGTDEEWPMAWLAAGQGLQRALLWARAAGMWAQVLHAPMVAPDTRLAVAQEIDRNFPLMLLRFGRLPTQASGGEAPPVLLG
jgi:hypothetical protein